MPSIAPMPRWGFPLPEGQSSSYWHEQVQSDSLLHYGSREELPQSVDTMIIGSGITGCVLAKSFLGTWPDKTLRVLEARECCSGATGRNAGHCKSSSWRSFPKYEKFFGAVEAIKILKNEDEAQDALIDYVRRHSIDCDLWEGDSFDVPVTTVAAKQARDAYSRYKDAGGDVDRISVTTDPTAAKTISGLHNAQACYSRRAATLQPWKLSAHVMRECLAMGVALYTHTVVQTVVLSSGSRYKWTVCTDRGNVLCNRVIHATNAYTGQHEPLFRGLINPNPHICNQVVPRSSSSGLASTRNSYTVLLPDGATVSINPRCRLDGSILFGGDNPGQRVFDRWIVDHPEHCLDDSFSNVKEVTDWMQRFATTELPGWKNETLSNRTQARSRCWSGILGMTSDRMPFVGEIPGKEGQWVCVALNGYGMTKVFTAAPGLIKLMNGRSWEDTGLPKAYRLTIESRDADHMSWQL